MSPRLRPQRPEDESPPALDRQALNKRGKVTWCTASVSWVRENRTPSSTGGRWKRGDPVGHPRVPGRCAERCHHDGLDGTQPTDQSLPRQRSTLLTHICAKTRAGRFQLKRITISKRMRAKLAAVKDHIKQRRHDPIPDQGRWLGSVVRGHLAYYAVPGNSQAIRAFRTQVAPLVQSAPAPQPTPPPGLAAHEPPHAPMATARPDPASLPRSAFRRHHPRQEPSAVVPHAGICAGGRP